MEFELSFPSPTRAVVVGLAAAEWSSCADNEHLQGIAYMSSPSNAALRGVAGGGGSSFTATSKSKHEVSAEDTVAGRLNQQRANKDNGICKPEAHEPTSVAMLTQESSRRTPAFRARGA